MNTRHLTLEGKLIAFFHQSSDLYGSDRILLDLVEAVREAGGEAVVLLPGTGPLTDEFAARHIEFHTLPVLKLSRARLSLGGIFRLAWEMMSALPTCKRIFGNRRVAMVHSNTIAVLGGALWALSKGVPHLWHVHEIVAHPRIAAWALPRLVNAMSDRVVCTSNATSQWMLDMQPSLARKTEVIWNGVHTPTLCDASAIAQLRDRFLPAGARIAIGLVGRINRLKGHKLLMDAVDQLHERGFKDFSVVFIGSAPPGQDIYLTQLEQRVANSPMRERIVMQGFTTKVWPAYAALDIVCVPSTEPESFGMVAAEAMAMGKPVVASRLGALTEVVVNGSTGLTFQARNAEALAAALAELLSDDALRERMGVAGQARVNEELSVERMTRRFQNTYAEMTKQQE